MSEIDEKEKVLEDNVIAITIKSCFIPKRELNEAVDFCKKENIKHIIIESDLLNVKEIAENPKKSCTYTALREVALY